MRLKIRVRLVGNLGTKDCSWVEVEVKDGDSLTIVQPVEMTWAEPRDPSYLPEQKKAQDDL